ncbi:MAG: Zn-ribbon domain-containing OB-fold protein [archaeon]|jgi:uncharacterized protein
MSVADFKEGLRNSTLKGRICNECNSMILPPRIICNNCGSTYLKEHDFGGKGVIKTKTVVYVPLTKFQDLNPYSVGIIKLDDGPMITGMILGEVDKIKIGDRVEPVYLDEGDEKLLAFRLVN